MLILACFFVLKIDKCLHYYRQHKVQQEKRSKNDQERAKENRHPKLTAIHQIIHDGGPAVPSYYLEDCEDGSEEVAEGADAILDHWIIVDAVVFQGDVKVKRTSTDHALWAALQASTVFGANLEELVAFGPICRIQRLFSQSASVVYCAVEFLQANCPKQDENEAEENSDVSKFRQRAEKSTNKLPHTWHSIYAFQRSNHSQNSKWLNIDRSKARACRVLCTKLNDS